MAFPSCLKSDKGPGYYMLPPTVGSNCDVTRTGSPAYSFGSRVSPSKPRQSPGPQAYDVSQLTRFGRCTVPTCVLGARLQQGGWYPLASESPGPCTYSPEMYRSIQSKLTPRQVCQTDSTPKRSGKLMNTPGPGAYGTPALDAYKTRQPRVKMPPSLHILRN